MCRGSATATLKTVIALWIALLSVGVSNAPAGSGEPALRVITVGPPRATEGRRASMGVYPPGLQSKQWVTLYHPTGAKVFEGPIDLLLPGDGTGDDHSTLTTRLASGSYLCETHGLSPTTVSKLKASPYFEDVSASHLPDDSVECAYTAMGDLTGDSLPDVVFAITTFNLDELRQPQIWVNMGGGHFENQTDHRLPPDSMVANDVSLCDIDSDGDLDIYLAAEGGGPGTLNDEDRLLINDGTGHFTDESATRLPPWSGRTQSVDVGLVNDDAYPDLVQVSLIENYGGGWPLYWIIRLLSNRGDGTFADSSHLINYLDSTGVADVLLADVDGDQRLDIVTSSYGGQLIIDPMGNIVDSIPGRNSILMQQANGQFVNETITRLTGPQGISVRSRAVDCNNDGAAELYFVNVGDDTLKARNVLYWNDGSGHFQDQTASRMPPETILWNNDAEFFDVDQNGYVDLFMINVIPGSDSATDALYLNSGGTFMDGAAHLPPILDFNCSSAMDDVDQDGDTDIVICVASSSFPSQPKRPRLYRNFYSKVDVTDEGRKLPASFELLANYPNPFNPVTTIPIMLSEPGRVRVEVFDVLGQQLVTLSDGPRSAGLELIAWDGRDRKGVALGSGVYFYRVTVGTMSRTRSMVLLKLAFLWAAKAPG